MLDAAVLYVIRMVLHILGNTQDDQEVIGSHSRLPAKRRRRRSLIRAIGSSLPLPPIQRVHFQIFRRSEPPPWRHQFFEEDCEPTFIPTLSDLPWIIMATPDKDIRSRSEYRPVKNKAKRRITMTVRPLHHTPPKYCTTPSPQQTPTCQSPLPFTTEPHTPPKGVSSPPWSKDVDLDAKVDDPVAPKKISALEDELEKLRSQIAMIVTMQSQLPQADPSHTPCTPVSRMSIAPTMAPLPPPPPPSFGAAPPPPPPPCGAPPPPPPPPPPISAPKLSAIDLIKQNRNKNKNKPKETGSDGMPNMADILKGLGTVKLKSVARSPGGTPVRKTPKPSEANDPASIIARALKKKFAHARLSCSPTAANKENINSSGSPVGKWSPARLASPKFGQHLLKPSIRAQPSIRQPRPLADVNT